MTKLVAQVALVPNGPHIDLAELTRVSAAIQKQIARDVSPIWCINATIDVISSLEQVPLSYWPIIIGGEELPEGVLGTHLSDDNQPYALVRNTTGWSLTASHECIEMLIDPFGNRFVAGQSPSPNQGRVLFLVEACDPCEGVENAYTVNDILVSDFYTPNYFDPQQVSGVRCDYTGSLTSPREVLSGGYLSWKNPQDGQYYQLQDIDGNEKIVSLGELARPRGSIREVIDHHPLTPKPIRQPLPRENRMLRIAEEKAWVTGQITARWAQELRRYF
jgi:hypothetical protein